MLRLPTLALLTFAVGATACSEEPLVGDADDVEFRQEDPIFDDLGIYVGPNTDSDECLIWEVTTSATEPGTNEVHERTGPGVPPPTDLVMTMHDPTIRDLDGVAVCERSENELVDTVTPSGDDEVLFTVVGPFIFEGGLDFEGKNKRQILRQLRRNLKYSIRGSQVLDGPFWRRDVLATATDNIMRSGPMGKMLIAAIIGGECGSSGIDAFEPPDDGDH